MPFDRPKVVVDLEEYLSLKKEQEDKATPLENLVLADLVIFLTAFPPGEQILKDYNRVSREFTISVEGGRNIQYFRKKDELSSSNGRTNR